MSEQTKKILTISGLVFITLIIAFMMARFEVVKRAKREFKEGEMHLSFYKDPAVKKAHYDALLSSKKISDPQYQMLMEDNSLKNAYIQYQTVVDLFTPPESKWVKMSREKLKEISPEYNAWVAKLQSEIDAASYDKTKPESQQTKKPVN